ncbi:hypothetical protein LINPERHAP2_LOCUS2104 [Linum perenne]
MLSRCNRKIHVLRFLANTTRVCTFFYLSTRIWIVTSYLSSNGFVLKALIVESRYEGFEIRN